MILRKIQVPRGTSIPTNLYAQALENQRPAKEKSFFFCKHWAVQLYIVRQLAAKEKMPELQKQLATLMAMLEVKTNCDFSCLRSNFRGEALTADTFSGFCHHSSFRG